jgi:hypothetical protein
MDSKYQIWKCSNELEANNYNWGLKKIQMLSGVQTFHRFMQPAMTYDMYYLASHFMNIDCVKKFSKDLYHNNLSSMFSYNSTTTKTVMLIQPQFSQNLEFQKNMMNLPKCYQVIKIHCFAKK